MTNGIIKYKDNDNDNEWYNYTYIYINTNCNCGSFPNVVIPLYIQKYYFF